MKNKPKFRSWECDCRVPIPKPSNSPRFEPDTQKPLLCVEGNKLWVCGQRNAAHIFAIAAVEVMRSRVGACRGERTSLFCINNRMSYCCTNWAVFYWARVSLREDRWWTPPPLPLIYTITSPDVCFANVFPIQERTTPAHPEPVTCSRRQKSYKKWLQESSKWNRRTSFVKNSSV